MQGMPYLATKDVEKAWFTGITVGPNHMCFTLTLTSKLIADQRSRVSFICTVPETLAWFAVTFG